MRPEEMRDDIPEDVREALARAMRGPVSWVNLQAELRDIVRPKPRTVRVDAEIPAPLTQVPDDGVVWTLAPGLPEGGVEDVIDSYADAAVAIGLGWATRAEALAALAALTARETPRPGADWTPHTPGDPMPCDGEALVDVRLRNGEVLPGCPADHNGWQRLDDDCPHDYDITAWRYTREDEA